jgi:hypothetical protein
MYTKDNYIFSKLCCMSRTHSKTKSVTNLQLMVAVLAAFLSGGLAFAGAKVNTPRPLVIN